MPLRSLVYSGGKSIHGFVEIGAKDAASWDKAIDTLLFAVAHPDAPQNQRADRACKNPDRLTRLAGATRADKGIRQTLLWLSAHAALRGSTIAQLPNHTKHTPATFRRDRHPAGRDGKRKVP